MSAESDNLETLSNKELYHRMTELGLPSIPVTDTTRKLLIKRIRHHVTEAKAKTRRETVAVVKYSSDEDSEAPKEKPKKAEVNRRATVAAPVAPKVIDEKPKPPPSRRSGRITPTVGVAPPPVVAPTVYEIIEDSDEEPEILTQRPPRRSKSKSPSLSRSDVVTTSYKQVIESVKESTEEEEAEDEAPELPTRFTQLNYRPPSVPRPPSSLSRRSLGGYSSLNSPSTSYTTYAGRYSSLGTRTLDGEDVDSPYLSDFTRNLLKSHRLDTGSSHFRADSSTARKSDSIADSIVAVFNALDRKFSLKRNLIILSVVLLIILVFVFFLY